MTGLPDPPDLSWSDAVVDEMQERARRRWLEEQTRLPAAFTCRDADEADRVETAFMLGIVAALEVAQEQQMIARRP